MPRLRLYDVFAWKILNGELVIAKFVICCHRTLLFAALENIGRTGHAICSNLNCSHIPMAISGQVIVFIEHRRIGEAAVRILDSELWV